ncbi:MAG: hypothetical protein HY869_05405 [Chloroflexi bacterium]|nr:hypothetical protein [Chloroflexota bacterium]
MTAHPPSSHPSLYAALFQSEAGDLSGFRVEKDHSQREKYLSLLETIRARIANLPLEPPARASLEGLFTQLIADQVRATYSAQDAFRMFLDTIREVNAEILTPEDDGLDDDLDELAPDAKPDQTFTSVFSIREME